MANATPEQPSYQDATDSAELQKMHTFSGKFVSVVLLTVWKRLCQEPAVCPLCHVSLSSSSLILIFTKFGVNS